MMTELVIEIHGNYHKSEKIMRNIRKKKRKEKGIERLKRDIFEEFNFSLVKKRDRNRVSGKIMIIIVEKGIISFSFYTGASEG